MVVLQAPVPVDLRVQPLQVPGRFLSSVRTGLEVMLYLY